MSFALNLKCRECGNEVKKDATFVCEYCFGPLEVTYDYESIKKVMTKEVIASRPKNLWRYKELLPLDGEPTDGLHSGFTPLVRAKNLAKVLGVKELYIKDDSVNYPTLSYKDRVVPVALSRAKELGFDTVGCASTGNLAHAVSAHAALAGLKTYIFIPAGLELGKIVACLIFKPNLIAVRGNYDEVNRLCTEIVSKYPFAFVNVNIRPYYTEGAKTYGLEVAEQLGWDLPRHMVLPVAGGTLLPKVWKGFKELHTLGLLKHLNVKLYAAQPQGSAPVSTAIKEGTDMIKPVKPKTIAKSLAIGNPADGYYAARTVQETGGFADEASDEEIVDAIKLLAQTEGIFTETAGGVTTAVAKKLIEKGVIPKDESILISITGNGLKTQEAVMNVIGKPMEIDSSLKAFEDMLKPQT